MQESEAALAEFVKNHGQKVAATQSKIQLNEKLRDLILEQFKGHLAPEDYGKYLECVQLLNQQIEVEKNNLR
jgi:hypothetical protein